MVVAAVVAAGWEGGGGEEFDLRDAHCFLGGGGGLVEWSGLDWIEWIGCVKKDEMKARSGVECLRNEIVEINGIGLDGGNVEL